MLPRTVKNHEGPRFYPTCKLINKLPCHIFTDADRRHETPVSEMKGSLLFSVMAVARVLAFMLVFWSSVSTGWHEEGQVILGHNELRYWREAFRDPKSFQMGSKYACPLLWKDTLYLLYWSVSMPVLWSGRRNYLYFLRLFTTGILEKKVHSKEHLVPLLVTHTCKRPEECFPTSVNYISIWPGM